MSAQELAESHGAVESITVTEYARRIGGGWRDGSPTGSGLWVAGGQLHAIVRDVAGIEEQRTVLVVEDSHV